MPAMDGLELCSKIKNNQATAHIPVILLTAKSLDEEKAEGYRAGADSYMTKPFNINTLLARMEALLEQQKRTLNRLEKQKMPSIDKKAATKDDTFLQQASQVIEKNLSNPDFSVKMLAQEVSISSSMLYRKISDILHINPNSFIRKTRMLKAAEMLEEGQLTISDVAFKCGFKDVSYFGVTFKKEFGVTPSQYQKKSNGNG
jgi:AraC-like DNA-binding protein